MVFVLIPAALSCSLVALRRPGTLGNALLFRVSVFAASAAKKQLIRRRSSLLEPVNEHALTTHRSHPNKLPPGVAAYWDCAEIQSKKSSSRS
ncbi:hypothetical protein T492DRAFT_866443 [Pavlovales sp. CCMP2436]|nr:hypothetical protein T492DRAFT_866443 [Pavlovales sp. CCMP2436]